MKNRWDAYVWQGSGHLSLTKPTEKPRLPNRFLFLARGDVAMDWLDYLQVCGAMDQSFYQR